MKLKRMFVLFIAFILLCAPATALAETSVSPAPNTTDTSKPAGSPSPDATDETEPVNSVSFTIDNINVYEGMDKAYKDGYTPSVKDGTATVLLPLVASGEIKGNTITATPNLGEPSTAPFVFKNYQKTVGLNNNAVNGGSSTVPSYLIRFDLSLKADRINGIYPVTIDIQSAAADGSPVQQSFTCYVTITDGKAPVSEETPQEPETEQPTSQPKIIVSGYSVNPSPVTAGEEFTLTVTLKNTSDSKSVQNMTVTATTEAVNLSLLNETNVTYIKKLGKGNTTEIELKYKTDLETPAQRYNIALAMEYDNSDATPLTSAGTVAVEVVQPLRVQLQIPQIESEVNAGDTMPLSFQAMNLGRSKVYNVRIELSAPGLIPSGTAFVGNMEAGTAAEANLDVFIGTKNMSEGYEGEDKYGYTNGTIKLIYEDSAGKEYTEETEFSTTINQPVIASTSSEPEKEPEKAGQWWISIVIGVVVIGGLAAYLVIRGRLNGQKHEDI